MSSLSKQVRAVFFRTAAGGEPVRDWLKAMEPIEDRKRIGIDIKLSSSAGPLACQHVDRLKVAYSRFEQHLPTGALRECSSTATPKTEWCFFMAS